MLPGFPGFEYDDGNGPEAPEELGEMTDVAREEGPDDEPIDYLAQNEL